MASIPGFRFDITGASGSQGLLSPKSSWRAYVLPRGGYAKQDSTGTLITFDSAAVASRYAANDWIQSGLLTANIRQVSAVGGNSIAVSGSAVTVSENDRIFLIGTTQPTVTGGSATYQPATTIRERDDDASDIITNSMVTSNANGLIQAFAGVNLYDCLIQDGDQSNQGSIIDLPIGIVEGISISTDALFGASVTVNGAFGVTGWATFGSTVTMNAALGVTGWATFGASTTITGALGVTGTATFSGPTIFGATATANGAFGVTGTAVFGNSVTVTGNLIANNFIGVSYNQRVTGAVENVFTLASMPSTLGNSISLTPLVSTALVDLRFDMWIRGQSSVGAAIGVLLEADKDNDGTFEQEVYRWHPAGTAGFSLDIAGNSRIPFGFGVVDGDSFTVGTPVTWRIRLISQNDPGASTVSIGNYCLRGIMHNHFYSS